MSVYKSIMTGLNEAVEYEKGKGKVRAAQCTVAPVPDFTAEEIRALRQALYQSLFKLWIKSIV